MSAEAVHPPAFVGQGSGGILQVLTFHLAGHKYAMPLAHVREITPQQDLNKMPHMPKGVEGLLNLRGEVIPVVSLRVRLGFTLAEEAPAPKILILELPTGTVGLLVDGVDSVMNAQASQFTTPSPLLLGQEGAWIHGFLVIEGRIIALLDPLQAGSLTHHGRGAAVVNEEVLDLERRLDEGLQSLIAMAPERGEGGGRVIPQMEDAIQFTEQEMAKVLDQVEGMLGHTDSMFKGLGFLKHEVGLGRLKGHEKEMVELEKLMSKLQEAVFSLIQQIQFQDIARQKLERVLNHLRGLQGVVGGNLRATKKDL